MWTKTLSVLAFLLCTCSIHCLPHWSSRNNGINVMDIKLDGHETIQIGVQRQLGEVSKIDGAGFSGGGHGIEGRMDVVLDLQNVIGTTGPKYVGVTLAASVFKWRRFDFLSKRLQALAKGLAPSVVRVGGAAGNFLIFKPNTSFVEGEKDDGECSYGAEEETSPRTNFTVTAAQWEQFNHFIQVSGWDLMFGFNEFLRKGSQWDPDNAKQILQFSQERNYGIPHFQMGNEPNSYFHKFHFRIPPSELVADMVHMRSLLSDFPAYSNSNIYGPDVTKVTHGSGRKYFAEFLHVGGQNIVSAATLHHYYFNARTTGAGLEYFINTTVLDSLNQELYIGTSIAHSEAPGLRVWLTETSSVSGGGLPGVSDAYVAGFLWLDKLGLSALYGVQAVIRQSFYHGSYPLVSCDYNPNPDYFLTVLYKRLVQGNVLRVTSTDTVRVYAHCANPLTYVQGALTVYVLNVKNETTTLKFPQFTNQPLDLYILTPGDEDGLKSRYSALNGHKLVMVGDELPEMPPLRQFGPVTIPPYSFGFIVIPDAKADICRL